MSKHVLALTLAVTAAACAETGSRAGTTTTTGASTSGQAELTRSVVDLSERMAASVCAREVRCGRQGTEACVTPVRDRARTELSAWNCSPAAARARVEECLASFDSASCEENLAGSGRPLCATNDACGREAVLVPPGRELGAEELGSRPQ